ncbi:hypothetical protein SAMN05444170_5400 [Bradyrhizobium erythrophlei]|uniref:Uncharacterized protein n=1 Tax=Bradyrhizobium erythrophlei TaxID=1437360 RepID=A0A1M7UJA9_9BRAD|nr:hypothetical protein SAMN05444170_5400 [Bradyrhizobium erythrophlei]
MSGRPSKTGLMDSWLTQQVTLIGMPMQNWMVVTLALILVATLINVVERR